MVGVDALALLGPLLLRTGSGLAGRLRCSVRGFWFCEL